MREDGSLDQNKIYSSLLPKHFRLDQYYPFAMPESLYHIYGDFVIKLFEFYPASSCS